MSSTPDYVMGSDDPGFTSMGAFTKYVNAVMKNTKIQKKPALPENEAFMNFFIDLVVSHWKTLKRHPEGRRFIKNVGPGPSSTTSSSQMETIAPGTKSATDRRHREDTEDPSNATANETTGKKPKKPMGTLKFVGLCLAVLYGMSEGIRTKKMHVLVPKCEYASANAPLMKDLELYDPAYDCKLITPSKRLLKLAYETMETGGVLTEKDFQKLSNLCIVPKAAR